MTSGTPSIAICGSYLREDRIPGWGQDAIALPFSYVSALQRAGGHESVLAPTTQRGELTTRLRCFDGLLLAGGEDVDPRWYRKKPHPRTNEPDRIRDGYEIALLRVALERDMPVLAICRGMQILNVCRGGSLIQHLPDVDETIHHRHPDPAEATVHGVEIDPGSTLAKALGVETTTVISQHHQAIGRLGDGVRAVAWSHDGVIEGIELDDQWVVGVQWHPERSTHLGEEHQQLFDEFVAVSRAGR